MRPQENGPWGSRQTPIFNPAAAVTPRATPGPSPRIFGQRSCPSRSTRRVYPGRLRVSIAGVISPLCRHIRQLTRTTCQARRSSTRTHNGAEGGCPCSSFVLVGSKLEPSRAPCPTRQVSGADHRCRLHHGRHPDDHHQQQQAAGNVLTGLRQAGAAAECPPHQARIMMETPHFPRSYKSGRATVLFDAGIDFHSIFDREQWISTA